jgi:UDP-4-amino-4-deoxy-L-arabinose-oxoglutarate aminotransferase
MTQGAADRFQRGQYRHWDMELLGVKANLPDVLSAYLPPQIATIRERLPARQSIADRYREAFERTPIRMARLAAGSRSAEHIFPIHVPPPVRDEAIAALNLREIGVAVNYRSVPTLTYYRRKYGYTAESFPVSYEWGEGTITLPLYPGLAGERQEWVISAVLEDVVPRCMSVAAVS